MGIQYVTANNASHIHFTDRGTSSNIPGTCSSRVSSKANIIFQLEVIIFAPQYESL